jgi:uncharacterized protein YbaA (DUF1428 family)
MSYVDGFVLPLPRKNLAAYRKMAAWGRKIWMKHGALRYFECVGDDLKVPKDCGLSFPAGIRARSGETIVFAFIVYKSKAHRDAVNRKVLNEMAAGPMPAKMPFDMKRMMHGGFRALVEA